jgi:hypothetical protein
MTSGNHCGPSSEPRSSGPRAQHLSTKTRLTKPPLAYAGLAYGRDPNARGTANDKPRSLDALHGRPPVGLFGGVGGRTMNEIAQILKEYWAIVLGAVGSIAWLVRLESRSLSNEKEIRRLWIQRKEDLANAQHSRDAQTKVLDEIRQDIKKLLSQSSKGS